MLKSQQELLKLSELREKINTHPADGDTEKLGEYTTEAIDVERRYRAAVVVEAEAEARAESSGENAELRSLTEKASLGGLFEGVVEHRESDSEMRELQQAHGLASNAFPVEMLIEERAVTPAPGNVEGNQAAPIPYVFADSVSAFLSNSATYRSGRRPNFSRAHERARRPDACGKRRSRRNDRGV